MSGRSSYAKANLQANWITYSNDAVKKVVEKLFYENSEEFRYTSEEYTSDEGDPEEDNVVINRWTDFINSEDSDEYSPEKFDRPNLIFKIIRELVLTKVASTIHLKVESTFTNGYDVSSIKRVIYKTGITDSGVHINVIEKEVAKWVAIKVDNEGNEIEK